MQTTQIPSERTALLRPFQPTWPALIAIFVIVAGLYYLAGRFALLVLTEREGVAVFWPGSGLAAGIIAALTRPARMPILLAVAAATVVANIEARSSLPASLVFAACNAAECLIFVTVLERLDSQRTRLESLAGFGGFIVAAIVAAATAALPAALAIQLLGLSKAPLLSIWFTWFKSDGLGILALAPIIITLPRVLREPPGPLRLAEGVLGASAATLMGYLSFVLPPEQSFLPLIAPTTLLFPVFLFLAGRSPALFSAAGALGVSIVIVVAALAGLGRFGTAVVSSVDRMAGAEVAILTVNAAVLVLASMFAQSRNVTAALRSSDERLKLSLAAGGMYAFDLDIARGVVRRTGGLLDRLRLPEFGTLDDYRRSLDPADRAEFEEMLLSLSPADKASRRILRLLAADGETMLVEHRAEAVFDGTRLLNIRGTCNDITAQEAARLALEKSEAELRRALRAGRVYAFEYDGRTRKVVRSENAAEILGVSQEAANNSPNLFAHHLHPADRAALATFEKSHSRDRPFASGRFRFIRPAGGTIWLEVTSTAEYDTDGQFLRLRGLCRDVTESQLAEQRQEELIEELHHRVKNALATVKDVIVLSREADDTIDGFHAKIERRIDAMTRAHNLLTDSKWTGIDVKRLIEDEIESHRTGDNAVLEGADVILPARLAQPFAMTVHELATNAAKHGALQPGNGRIEVRWRLAGNAIEGERLEFSWHEITRRPVEAPKRLSYGLKAIRSQLPHAHEASVEVSFTPTGLHCDMTLQVSEPAETASPEAPAMAS